MRPLTLSGLVLLAVAMCACSASSGEVQRCDIAEDCSSEQVCVDGLCTPAVLGDTRDVSSDIPDGAVDDIQDTQLDTIDVTSDSSDLMDDDAPDPCAACGPAERCCDGHCVDVFASPLHCGECQVSCVGRPEVAAISCDGGTCEIDACAIGAYDCDNIVQNGCESQLDDATNCGACGRSCGTGESCVAGACKCGSTSVSMGTACASNQRCCAEACVPVNDPSCSCNPECSNGALCCSGSCFDPDNNDMHCGACGMDCGSSGTCVMGQCSCTMGVLNDDANCGACGAACNVGEHCENAGGVFQCECDMGLARCGGACVELDTSPSHCGMCNNSCIPGMNAQGADCFEGTCTNVCASNRADCDGDLPNGCEERLDQEDNCGSECATIVDCGLIGDSCESSPAFHCFCDSANDCNLGERCDASLGIDECTCGNLGSACGTGDSCCQTGGGNFACADLSSNDEHCGGCNAPCAMSENCIGGVCI